MKWHKIHKYFDLKHDFAQASLRISQAISKLQQQKNLQLLKTIEDEAFQWPPIFIIGPPRCGSTLLYQLLTHRYKFAYLQNRMQSHNYSIALHAGKHIDANKVYNSDFQSTHGVTKNPNGPHEGGYFWRRFYPRNVHDYVSEHTLSTIESFEIRNTLKFLERHFSVPFLSKNMEAGLRLHSLQKLFPEALYIVVKRDPRATASSLIKVRLDMYGTKEEWWSIRPKEYKDLIKHPYYEQVAYQVVYIYKAIFEDLPHNSRRIDIQYEDLCERPEETMNAVADKLRSHKVKLVDNCLDAPEKFPLKKKYLFTKAELERVEEIFIETGITNHVPFVIGKDA